MQFSLFEG